MSEYGSQIDLSMNMNKSRGDYKLLKKLEQKNAQQVYEKNTNIVIRRDYGVGIRMMRLFHQKLYDVEEFGNNESSEEEKEVKKQEANKVKEYNTE